MTETLWLSAEALQHSTPPSDMNELAVLVDLDYHIAGTSPRPGTATQVGTGIHINVCAMKNSRPAVLIVLLTYIVLLSLSGANCAQRSAGLPFTLKQVGPNVWAAIDNANATAPAAANAGFVIGDDAVTVIDTFWSVEAAKQLLAEIHKQTKLPVKFVIAAKRLHGKANLTGGRGVRPMSPMKTCMGSNDHDLVHFNLAIAKHAFDHPAMAGFASQLDAVNRLAEASPGFVWTTADGRHLEHHGPTPYAFTFKRAFNPKGNEVSARVLRGRN